MGGYEEAVQDVRGIGEKSISAQSQAFICKDVLFAAKGYCKACGYTGAFKH